MEKQNRIVEHPEILAPAGDEDCFLAALAAGADAIYLGLKSFSARMEAQNFSLEQLGRLVLLAHAKNCRVHVALNTLIKTEELDTVLRLVKILDTDLEIDGLIIQDPGLLEIARQADIKASLTLSTLANVSTTIALKEADNLGVNRVVIPRELSLDEMRLLGATCPEGLELECFVHGALCYCVSGRCYWSSYMGGKSGLRGRCVQPCRRLYNKNMIRTAGKSNRAAKPAGGERFFSCQDLQLGEIVTLLLQIPHLRSWKIEGRKKGPHYVYHTVMAYKILRDFPDDPQKRKLALAILEQALGRPGVKGRFLPQKHLSPMAPGKQTASGKLAGHIQISQTGQCLLKPHFQLLPKDYLRIGTQDEHWHSCYPVSCVVPKSGTLNLRLPAHKTPRAGTPVFLVDRREPELLNIIAELKNALHKFPETKISSPKVKVHLPERTVNQSIPDIYVSTSIQGESVTCLAKHAIKGIWVNPRAVRQFQNRASRQFFWLPPVLWPENEDEFADAIHKLVRAGAERFVCNSPWQIGLFSHKKNLQLIAGPFCNISNPLAIEVLKKMGFQAAFASPELSGRDLVQLPRHSPLPLGIIIGGYWPVGISRFGLNGVDVNQAFSSPKGESFWARNYGGNVWLYPGWTLNLCEKKASLATAGYSFFAWLDEKPPSRLPLAPRPGLFNWNNELK